MDFASIRSAVVDAWDFAYPPVLFLCGALLLARTLTGPSFFAVSVSSLSRALSISSHIARRLRAYGFATLLPLVALFLIVLVLFLTQTVVSALGDLLPGRVVYSSKAAWLHTEGSLKLARFWAAHPELADLHALTLFIEQRVDAFRTTDRSGMTVRARHWERNQDLAVLGLSAVKVYLFLTLVLLIATRTYRSWRIWVRLLIVVVALWTTGLFFVARQVYSREQAGYLRGHALDIVCSSDDRCRAAAPAEILSYRRLIEGGEFVRTPWWHFEYTDSLSVKWLMREFLGRGATHSGDSP